MPDRSPAWLLSSLALSLLVTACSLQPSRQEPPSPVLRLSFSPDLALPRECRPTPGQMYRAEFVVQSDGSVSQVTSIGDTACARQALEQWVAGFRYEPPGEPTAAVVDWMLVEGDRGG